MKRNIKSKLILCMIIINLAITGIICNEFNVKYVEDNQNSKNDVISDLKDTSGNWELPINKSVGDYPIMIFIGDANNDGYNDIATANGDSDNVSILLWNSTSEDWDPQITRPVRDGPYSVFIGDANNDGYNDIATANYDFNDVSILLWNSTLEDWDPQITRFVGNNPGSVSIADANNDGYNDIITANPDYFGYVSILLWNSTSEDWDPMIFRFVGNNPFDLSIGDANNDGYNDIATANSGSNNVSILLWNSTLEDWDPQITRSVGNNPGSVSLADANNDGYNDIATANGGSVNVSILLWNSTSEDWDPQITRPVGDGPYSVFIGDANNDGYNDIATANDNSDNVSILLWNSTSEDWDPQITRSVGDHPARVFIGDVNNDGYNDIVTANRGSDDISILLWKEEILYLNLTSPENKTYTEPMNGYYPATFGFENDEDGQDPEGWVIDQESIVIEVISESYNHKKVLRLSDSSTINPSRVHNSFSSKDYGTVELWILQDTLGGDGKRGQISGRGNGNQIFLVKMVGGSPAIWQARDNGIDINITGAPTPLINTWYHVQIDFEHTTGGYQGLSENEYYVYIDGIRYGPYLFSFDEQLDELHLHTYSYGSGYSTYFDAVGYSWDPNYNIGDNLNEGLLISYETNLNLNWKAFSLDNQQNITIYGNFTIPFPEDGIHNFQIFGNDSSGNNYKSNLVHFSIDTSPPDIIINSPNDNEFFGVFAPNFDISINELNINTTWYTLDGGVTKIIFNGLSGILNQTEWSKKNSELVTIRFYANDSFGLENYAEVMINKDIDSPSSIISFIPHSGTNIVNKSTTFSLVANDGIGSGVAVLRYKINNSNWEDYIGPFDLPGYNYGYYLITYQAIDAVGNIESENTLLVLLVEIPSKEPEIPGFSTFLMLSLIGLVSLILIKRYKK